MAFISFRFQKLIFPDYIIPFLNGLSTIANFTVKTQWVYQVEIHNPQKQIPDESKLSRHYAIQEDALPHVITAFEKKLGNQISNDPAIHLVVYVPPCGLAPLRIYRKDGSRASTNNVEAFTSAKWGGIVLANPSEDAIAKCLENSLDKADIYISSQDVMPVLLFQLRKNFDLENNVHRASLSFQLTSLTLFVYSRSPFWTPASSRSTQ